MRVPSQEPNFGMDDMSMGDGTDMGMPPMDDTMGGMTNDPAMSDGMDMGGMPQQQENYGADFDAGVEANEEEDPKKFIQQLTGKLSTSLNKYNQSLPQPDAELSKYVAGMIIKQAIEGLSQEDVSDIMDKIQSDDETNETPADDGMTQEQPQDDGMNLPMDDGSGQMPPMNEAEAMNSRTGNLYDKLSQGKPVQKARKTSGYNRSPYNVKL